MTQPAKIDLRTSMAIRYRCVSVFLDLLPTKDRIFWGMPTVRQSVDGQPMISQRAKGAMPRSSGYPNLIHQSLPSRHCISIFAVRVGERSLVVQTLSPTPP